MQETNETNLILNQGILDLSKKGLQEYGKEEAEKFVSEGWADPLLLSLQAKKYLEVLTAFNKTLKEAVIAELEKHGGRTEIGNSKIALGNTGQRLSYEDDPIYVELQKALKDRAELLKMAQKQSIVDAETGEQIPKVGIKSHGEIIAKITL